MIIGHIGLIGLIEIITKKNPAAAQPGFSLIAHLFIYQLSAVVSMLSAPSALPFQLAFVSFTAHTLYSGMPEMGSKAAFVRRLAAANA